MIILRARGLLHKILSELTITWNTPLTYDQQGMETIQIYKRFNVKLSIRILKWKKSCFRPFSKCPQDLLEPDLPDNKTMSCTWSLSTSPQYRHSHTAFVFGLYVNNTFGSKNWTYRLKHFSRGENNRMEE